MDPVKVLLPETKIVPAPVLVNRPDPLITLGIESDEADEILNVPPLVPRLIPRLDESVKSEDILMVPPSR